MYDEMYEPSTYTTGVGKSRGYRSDSRNEYGYDYNSTPNDSRYPSGYGDYRQPHHDGGYDDGYDNGYDDGYDPNDGYGYEDDGYGKHDSDGYGRHDGDGYGRHDGDGYGRHDGDDYGEYDEFQDNEAAMRQAPSFSSPQGTPSSKQKRRANRPQSASSIKGTGLRTSDQAFEITAKLIVDYLSPKLEEGATSYYLDPTDTIFLDAVVPQDIRPEFVDAVAFRAESLTPFADSRIDSLVRECHRLGLGQKNSFLLGGGEKTDDCRILINVVQEIPSNPSMSSISTKGTKSQSRPTSGQSSRVSKVSKLTGSSVQKFDLKTSDQAFEMTAKLIVDYLSPKLPQGSSSYHVDASDIVFLDAVVPEEIRPGFVEAVAFRAESLTPGEDCPIESLVRECQRLGLGKKNTFLLGGGMKMDDGRILVLPGSVKVKKGRKTKKKKSQKPTAEANMNWLANSGLPPDQMKLIMSAMSDVGSKTDADGTSPNNQIDNATSMGTKKASKKGTNMKQDKIAMNENRRKRTTNGKILPPIGAPGAQNRPQIAIKKADQGFIKPSFSNANMSSAVIQPSASNVGTKKEVIGGPPPLKKADSSNPSGERALTRRMRSLERRSKIGLYEQSFEAPVKATWRDDLWDFASHGLFHKFLILSFIAPLFALGQIQTRAKLTWLGLPAESVDEVRNIYCNIVGLVFGWLLSNTALILTIYWYWINGVMHTSLVFFTLMLNLAYFGFHVIVCANTRWTIRRRGNIPQVFELADYLMPLFYLPLVIAQLGRHTADYEQLDAYIFSATGLFPGVETSGESNYIQPQIEESEVPAIV